MKGWVRMTVEQEQMGIMDRLRTETRPHHDRAEESEFGTSMMAKQLPLSAYKIHIAASNSAAQQKSSVS